MPRQIEITPQLKDMLQEAYEKTRGITRYGREYMEENLGYSLSEKSLEKLWRKIDLVGVGAREGIDRLFRDHFSQGVCDAEEMARLITSDIAIDHYSLHPESARGKMIKLGLIEPASQGGKRNGFSRPVGTSNAHSKKVGKKIPSRGDDYAYSDPPEAI